MSSGWYYRGGDYYQLDDNTGFKVRASQTQQQWNGIVTVDAHFNPRQPQDLVVGVKDDQSVGVPRPRQVNQFTVVGTVVTAFAARGSSSIDVDSTVGFTVGDACQVMLDTGVQFSFTLATIGANSLGWTGAGLPATVGGNLGDPLENAVLDLTSALIPPNDNPVPAY